MSLECRKSAGEEYVVATLDQVAGDVLDVTYDDGSREQTLLRLVRVPRSPG
jgi:hypothetical protein